MARSTTSTLLCFSGTAILTIRSPYDVTFLPRCNVTPEGYAHLTYLLSGLAGGKIIVALEGGYNLTSISESMAACVRPVPFLLFSFSPFLLAVFLSHTHARALSPYCAFFIKMEVHALALLPSLPRSLFLLVLGIELHVLVVLGIELYVCHFESCMWCCLKCSIMHG